MSTITGNFILINRFLCMSQMHRVWYERLSALYHNHLVEKIKMNSALSLTIILKHEGLNNDVQSLPWSSSNNSTQVLNLTYEWKKTFWVLSQSKCDSKYSLNNVSCNWPSGHHNNFLVSHQYLLPRWIS